MINTLDAQAGICLNTRQLLFLYSDAKHSSACSNDPHTEHNFDSSEYQTVSLPVFRWYYHLNNRFFPDLECHLNTRPEFNWLPKCLKNWSCIQMISHLTKTTTFPPEYWTILQLESYLPFPQSLGPTFKYRLYYCFCLLSLELIIIHWKALLWDNKSMLRVGEGGSLWFSYQLT